MARRKYSNPVVSRTLEMLISSGVVYLLTPTLHSILAPLQAQINAGAINNGQTPTTQGLSQVSNTLVQVTPNPNPTPTQPLVAQVPLNLFGS